MTKQEYVARLNVIDEDKHLGITNRLIVMNNLKREYIASLEAENAALTATNEKLEKLNSAALEQLSEHACPPYRHIYGQPCNDSDDCVACWRDVLMQEADAQKEN